MNAKIHTLHWGNEHLPVGNDNDEQSWKRCERLGLNDREKRRQYNSDDQIDATERESI